MTYNSLDHKLKNTSINLFLLRLIKIFLSIFILIYSAKYFGVGVEMDVWLIVTAFVTTISLSIWGPINETFRAKYAFIKEKEGPDIALNKASSLIFFILIVSLVLVLIIVLFARSLVPFLASSLKGNQKEFFVSILFLMLPSFIINQLTTIGTSILNAYNVLYLPEVIGVVSSLINLVLLIILAPKLGLYSLVTSQYISSIILLLFLVYSFYDKKIILPRLSIKNIWKNIKPFILYSLPFIFPYLIAQVSILIERNLSNLLGVGVVSIVNYASQFKSIIQAVFTSVLASVMVPSLARIYAKKETGKFQQLLKNNIDFVFICNSLIIPFLFGAAEPIANLLYNHGGMDTKSINTIVYLIRIYSFSIISVMLYLIFGFTLLSQQLGKKYAFHGVIAQLITILVNSFFYKRFGAAIFPISLLLSHLVSSLFMLNSAILNDKKKLVKEISLYVLLILLLSGSLYLVCNSFNLYGKNLFLKLLLYGIILCVLNIIYSHLLGINTIKYIMFFSRKISPKI